MTERQTALVAKQAAEVDVLSGGRLRLGVGLGWNPVEFTGLNEDFSNRGRRSVEQVEVMQALWADVLAIDVANPTKPTEAHAYLTGPDGTRTGYAIPAGESRPDVDQALGHRARVGPALRQVVRRGAAQRERELPRESARDRLRSPHPLTRRRSPARHAWWRSEGRGLRIAGVGATCG